MRPPVRVLLPLVALAAVEGIVLIGYAVYVAVNGLREGTTGPAEVSNPPALISLVVILALLGAGMLLIARGWWQARRGARSPFVFAQLILGLVGWEASQSLDSAERTVGYVAVAVAVIGIVLAVLPVVSRAISTEE